jgi:D-alanyl-D-alanine carboxypeptidase
MHPTPTATTRRGPGPLADVTGVRPFTWTAGAVVSTPADVARFYRALLRGRLLPTQLLRTMQTTVAGYPGTRAGLGIFSRRTPCGTAWGHQEPSPDTPPWRGRPRTAATRSSWP